MRMGKELAVPQGTRVRDVKAFFDTALHELQREGGPVRDCRCVSAVPIVGDVIAADVDKELRHVVGGEILALVVADEKDGVSL